MHHRWWIGAGLLGVLIAALAWAGATGSPAFVDDTGRVVPTTTQPRPMWIPAAVCVNATPGSVLDLPTTSPAVPACVTGTNTQQGVLDFADAANLSTQLAYVLPTTWTGDIGVRLVWFSATITGSVVWQVQVSCVAIGQVDDPTWDADVLAITDATQPTTPNLLNDATGTLLVATHLSTCAAGERLHLKVFRDATAGTPTDTLAGTARLLGMELTIRLRFA